MVNEIRPAVLRDYFRLQRGTTYKSRLLDQPGPVLLGLATIQRNGGFRTDSLRTYGGESPDKLLVQPGELYLSLKDVTQSADLLGAVARLPIDQPPGRLTQDTVKLEPKSSEVPLDYLYWLLRTPQYRSYCRAHATGTTNLGLARDDFLAFPAPEPTPLQREIVETLNALEAKIELNRQMTQTLEAVARVLYQSWFVDFDPVRAKAAGKNPRLPKAVAKWFPNSFDESEVGAIPSGWKCVAIGKLVKALSGGTPSKGVAALWAGDIPWISPKVMNAIHADVAEAFVSPDAIGNGTRLAPKGSVLVMVRGMGLHQKVRVCQARGDVAFNQDVKALVPRDIDGSVLLFALLHAQEFLLGKVESSGHGTGRLSTDILLGLSITVPNMECQLELAPHFSVISDRIELARSETKTLESLRAVILPRLGSEAVSGSEIDKAMCPAP